jgi:osmotically-inducible protein OsmY
MHSPCRPLSHRRAHPSIPRSWIALAALLLLLAGSFKASAQPAVEGTLGALQSPLTTPSPLTKTDPVLDCRTTLRARQAVQNDPALAGITHLGVSVRSGVACLWGAVSSPEAARRAEMLVRQVPGIVDVRNEIQVQNADDPLVQFLRLNRAGKVARAPSPQWVSANRPTGLLLSRAEEPTPPPSTNVSNGGNNITLLPPIALVLPSADPDLMGRINALQQSEPKFLGTVADVQSGVVRLGGFVSRWEDIMALARKVSQLPGVERVILHDVRTPGDR